MDNLFEHSETGPKLFRRIFSTDFYYYCCLGFFTKLQNNKDINNKYKFDVNLKLFKNIIY